VAGMRLAAPMAISVAVYGVVFGVLARQVEMSLLETILMNVIVFAGAAQLAALDAWVYPLPVLALVITVALVNMRLIMLGAALRPWMRTL
ncbi:AzlC family ABC transporter permease, partial [Klebsiella pneumoniae]|nr:AzlC family ABC transporter permease [Klebsiella pneumoniae]